MRMALVKVALATTVGVVTLAACGSANDGYDPSIATAVGYVSGSNQSGNTGTRCRNCSPSRPPTSWVTPSLGSGSTGTR